MRETSGGKSLASPHDTEDSTSRERHPALDPTLEGGEISATGFTASLERSPLALFTTTATHLGRFALLAQLGKGGMGSVFAAYDDQLDRRVALKLLHRRRGSSEEQRQQTLREARAVARISHPNVISVYEVGESGEHIYIAMEYVDGETLRDWQYSGVHSWREILDKYLAAGAGLAFAHGVGVVHRDFKPDNVLIGKDGRVRVADFGLARLDWGVEVESAGVRPKQEPKAQEPKAQEPKAQAPEEPNQSGRLTLPGVISGTPGYMSPEQYRGGNVDSRSDQWNFCVALFEALYGYKPFVGETVEERAARIQDPPRLPPRDTQVPEEIHRVLLRGLAKDREQRYPTMNELLAALTLEQGDHAGAGTLSRVLFLRWFFGVALVLVAILQLRNSQGTLTLRGMAIASGVLFIVVLGAGIYRRQTLLANRFHRSMWLLCLVTLTETVLQRTVAYKLGMPLPWLFPFEMVVLAATMSVAGMFLVPWLLWVPLVPILFAGLSLWGVIPERLLTLAHLVILSLLVVGWSRAANQAKSPAVRSDKKLFPLLKLRTWNTSSSGKPSLRRSE